MLDIHENSGRCISRYFDSLLVPLPGNALFLEGLDDCKDVFPSGIALGETSGQIEDYGKSAWIVFISPSPDSGRVCELIFLGVVRNHILKRQGGVRGVASGGRIRWRGPLPVGLV
jgi:hypothetical protein